MGDRQWKELLERHDATTAGEVERHRGGLAKTTGDGVSPPSTGPPGPSLARSICQRVASLGIDVRVGPHTGEVERRAHDVAGIGVHIGARGRLAGPGEVLASQTVKDLVIGSELEFESCGPHTLKGVPGEWQLYAVSVMPGGCFPTVKRVLMAPARGTLALMEFTDEHAAFRKAVRDLVDHEINPHIDEWEEKGQFPGHELFPKLGAAGLLGLEYDPE